MIDKRRLQKSGTPSVRKAKMACQKGLRVLQRAGLLSKRKDPRLLVDATIGHLRGIDQLIARLAAALSLSGRKGER